MRIQVRFFSLLRDRSGLPHRELEVPEGSDVSGALELLGRDHPDLAPYLGEAGGLTLVAVNRDYAPRSRGLRDGDELALFPPVSGGAPESRGMLLLSGGFDSPVAGHFALSQGHMLDAVHFSMEPFTDDASVRKARELARLLGVDRLVIVPIGPELAEVAKKCDPGAYFILQKRLMVRLAEHLARERGARFLLTGENLGQVSSQTLPNLGAIDAAAGIPVLRPLLGMDKQEIINTAQRIGTYETSKGPEICDVLATKRPILAARLHEILNEETKIDLVAMMASALARAWVPTAARAAPAA